MKRSGHRGPLFAVLGAVLLLAVGCQVPLLEPTPTTAPSPTPSLPPADEVAFEFLQAWAQDDLLAMYDLLSPASQERYTEVEFVAAYEQVARQASVLEVVPQILAAFQPGARAEVTFSVRFRTAAVGEFDVPNRMGLTYEAGMWGVDWSPALILPQLSDETFIHFSPRTPSRGNIYDRNGLGLAVQGELVEVGVIPGQIQDEGALLAQLSALLGQAPEALRARYAEALPDWYVPLGEIGADAAAASYLTVSSLPGVEFRQAWTRSYRPEIVAPHVVGVVGPIPEEELDLWRAQGYTGDELVGRLGLERWGEPHLAGEQGGLLEILFYSGQQVAVLADKPSRQSSNIYTTFEREFQRQVQDILGQRLGAIVVLEAQTGRVLAMATYPGFDPNPFARGISETQWASLQTDGRRPLVNRAAQGTYPAGSVFKVVTMAAAMEQGGLTAASSFLCRGTWTGLGADWPKKCWLASGHGNIPLDRALTSSCDITFYQVGLLLNGLSQDLLPAFARQCGLGALTGLEVEQQAGLVPDPAWKIQAKGEGWAPGDTVNLAIGQSELLVTPLQVAALLAAVGNGGTLYSPQVVQMIAADPNNPEWTFEPVVAAQLPISQDTLAVIQRSLLGVTASPAGTAYEAFKGLELPV
ncbi:MAG TPA: penicillin-binding transpeptidase domain-containing protein, partial [Anaerolineae bacterium]|nr:penicillin-binding transpeptidase domain-containing protein [Anaerolineae bacterium]